MAYLILPSRWRQQPQYPVRPRSYWLSRGLVFLFQGSTFVDLVSQQSPSLNSGGVSLRSNPQGWMGPDISGTQYLEFPSSSALNITGALSVIWRGVIDTTGTFRNTVSKSVGNATTNSIYDCYAHNTTPYFRYTRSNATGYGLWESSTTAVTVGVPITYGNLFPALLGTAPTSFVNGVLQTITTLNTIGGPATTNTNPLRIGRRDDGVTQLDGSVELIAWFNQQLTAAEYLAIYAAPWGELVEPLRRRIYVSLPAGGTTIALTLSAPVTASSVLSRSIAATRSASTTAVASVTRIDAKTFAASSTASATVQPLKAILRSLSASSTLSAALTRQAQVVRQASSIASSTVSRAVAVTRSAATTASAALVRQGLRSLAASTSIAALLVRQAGKSLAPSTMLSAALATLKQAGGLTLTAATTVSATLARSTAKIAIAGLGQLVTLVLPSGTATVSGWLQRARRHLTR